VDDAAQLVAEARLGTVPLRPWSPEETADCPLVLADVDRIQSVTVEPDPGFRLESVNGTPAAGWTQGLPPAKLALVPGVNWVRLSGPGAVAGRVRLARLPGVAGVRVRDAPPPAELAPFDAIFVAARAQAPGASTDDVLKQVSVHFPDPRDRAHRWYRARLDVFYADWYEMVERLDDSDPPFASAETRRKARRALEALQTILAREPGRWDAWHDAGSILWRTVHEEAARAALAQALANWPAADWTWRELARWERRRWLVMRGAGPARLDERERHRVAALRYLERAAAFFARRKRQTGPMIADVEALIRELKPRARRPPRAPPGYR
jgi:hypothetical protein